MSSDNETDYYEMSDEEFMNMSAPDEGADTSLEADQDHIEPLLNKDEDGFDLKNDGSLDDNSNTDQEDTSEDSSLESDSSEEDNLSSNLDSDDEDSSDNSEEDGDSQSDEEEDDRNNEEDTTNQDNKKSEAESLLEEVFAPFKANGVEMQVKSPEEARRLMQQGANYNKKMQQLKPNLKILKKLGNNELLDESKLNYLIDLSKGDPAAISKLLKENSIDPLTVDTDKADDYKPNAYNVTDSEVALDETLSDLKGTSSYDTTLDVVNNKWDEASRAVIRQHPDNLRIINSHIEAGIYDVINTEVQRQRALGNINGISDIDAYQQVGESLKEAGALDQYFSKPKENLRESSEQKPKSGKKPENKTARKAAKAPANKSGSKRSSADSSTNKEVWEMSDAEFEKAMESGSLF